jgi:3-hydroxyisobutyrate dehydrogenase
LGANGAFGAMKKGSLFVDHTTASASIARELAADAEKRGFDFVDAPVSGGQAGAVNGKLGIMCGGSEAGYARAEPVMAVYTKLAKRLGPAGSGQLTKMANQICIAGIVQGMAEAYSLMRAAGLDIEAVTEVISKGAAQSWQMENRIKTMSAGEYNHGFAVEWMRKDLNIALEEARRQGVSLPVTALVDQFYAEVENLGGKRWDTSSLFVRQETARRGNKS